MAAEVLRSLSNFDQEHLRSTLWALARQRSLAGACSLFQHVARSDYSFCPLCFEALFMGCEQKELVDQMLLQHGLRQIGMLIMIAVAVMEISMLLKVLILFLGLMMELLVQEMLLLMTLVQK